MRGSAGPFGVSFFSASFVQTKASMGVFAHFAPASSSTGGSGRFTGRSAHGSAAAANAEYSKSGRTNRMTGPGGGR